MEDRKLAFIWSIKIFLQVHRSWIKILNFPVYQQIVFLEALWDSLLLDSWGKLLLASLTQKYGMYTFGFLVVWDL